MVTTRHGARGRPACRRRVKWFPPHLLDSIRAERRCAAVPDGVFGFHVFRPPCVAEISALFTHVDQMSIRPAGRNRSAQRVVRRIPNGARSGFPRRLHVANLKRELPFHEWNEPERWG